MAVREAGGLAARVRFPASRPINTYKMNTYFLQLKNWLIDFIPINFYLRDILDILIVAFLAYLFIALIRRTRSFRIILGFLFFIGLYLVSLLMNLSLSVAIFQYLLGITFLILIITFQKELRRFFEFLSFWPFSRKKEKQDGIVEIISQAVNIMAEKKIGSLIVIPGQNIVDDYCEGGTYLGGKVSFSLLLSIFNVDSPGHDGAVLIEGDEIKKFALHLPLAENFEMVKKFGTRHRAALGLAEKTDALIIAVSEEKGTISLARNGKITIYKNDEFKRVLEDFYRENSLDDSYEKMGKKSLRKAYEILTSIVLALIAWLFFNFQTGLTQKNYIVPVEFRNLGSDMMVEFIQPKEIILTVKAKDYNFKTLKPDDLNLKIDLKDYNLGWYKERIDRSLINLDANFTVVNIEPDTIKFKISKLKNQL